LGDSRERERGGEVNILEALSWEMKKVLFTGATQVPKRFTLFCQGVYSLDLAREVEERIFLPPTVPLAIVAGPLSGKKLVLSLLDDSSQEEESVSTMSLSSLAHDASLLRATYCVEPGVKEHLKRALILSARGGRVGFTFEVVTSGDIGVLSEFEIVSGATWLLPSNDPLLANVLLS